eukprot:gene30616-34554_t
MTLMVFAGSAQLASLPLIAAGAPIWVIFLTAFAVNLRFVIFSVILAPHFAGLPWRQRFVLGYCSGDMTAALFLQKYPSVEPVRGKVSYLKGLMYPNWAAWQIGSIAGVFLGSAVPAEWGLGFAGTLAIICIMVPLTANRPAVVGVIVAGAVFTLETRRRGQTDERLAFVILGAVVGGAVFMRMGTWLQHVDLRDNASFAEQWLYGNRSILGGLVGAWLGVHVAKRAVGYKIRTGDLFAPAVALGMAVGRIGCLLTE